MMRRLKHKQQKQPKRNRPKRIGIVSETFLLKNLMSIWILN